MSDAFNRFDNYLSEASVCLKNNEETGHEFSLRYVWVTCVSSFDLFMTEFVAEAGLRLIDKSPADLTQNLNQIGVPLERVFAFVNLSPSEKLLFYREAIFSSVRFRSFYKPDGVSTALSFIWVSPPKEKWKRILEQMRASGRYAEVTEQDIRAELSLIGDRRDLIAHSVDLPPGASVPNPVVRSDAEKVITFIYDLAKAIEDETEAQLASTVGDKA